MNNTYFCKEINNDISVDGDVNKADWANIEEVYLKENVTGNDPKMATCVKSVWNEKYIYFLFNCKDYSFKATMTEFNDKLFEEDVVEIFIDDNRDLKTYIEIEINPLNAVLHYSIHNNLNRKIFTYAKVEKVVESKVIRNNETGAYSVEAAIPLPNLLLPKIYHPKRGIGGFSICIESTGEKTAMMSILPGHIQVK
jgi:hypothetical protein